MKLSLSSPAIILSSLLVIPPAIANPDDNFCYMRNEQGQVINLSEMCGMDSGIITEPLSNEPRSLVRELSSGSDGPINWTITATTEANSQARIIAVWFNGDTADDYALFRAASPDMVPRNEATHARMAWALYYGEHQLFGSGSRTTLIQDFSLSQALIDRRNVWAITRISGDCQSPQGMNDLGGTCGGW